MSSAGRKTLMVCDLTPSVSPGSGCLSLILPPGRRISGDNPSGATSLVHHLGGVLLAQARTKSCTRRSNHSILDPTKYAAGPSTASLTGRPTSPPRLYTSAHKPVAVDSLGQARPKHIHRSV